MNQQIGKFLKTKIVCTLGPSSTDRPTLDAMAKAGMDVARLNMSHSGPDQMRAASAAVRASAAAVGKPIAVMVDLQGAKIRVGQLAKPIQLETGGRVVLVPQAEAAGSEIPITYVGLAADLEPGNRILLSDGQIELLVRGTRGSRIETEVVIGGKVTSGRGINLPGARIAAPALMEKDLIDLEAALEIEADYVALSFVRSADNVRELRRHLPEDALILSKIEKDLALQDLVGILEASDAVMVARGDLGSELPFEQVPLVQKRIVRDANDSYRPVVIATEMLESMINQLRPTRAEVSDVANSILDGTDAVMLAAETAIGHHPVRAVQALSRVIAQVESESVCLAEGPPYDVPASQGERGPISTEVAVASATLKAAQAVRAPAIVTYTRSGFTARVVSSRRPPVPIVAVTDSERVQRQLSLVWGVLPVLSRGELREEVMATTARSELLARGLAQAGDRIVVTAGLPFHVRGTTNMVRIETL